jgi:endonuclease/exonuclease/phosphatase (EEP) superfamily protein YafD
MRIRPGSALAWLVVLGAAVLLWARLVPFPGRGRLDAVAPLTQLTAIRPALTALAVVAGLAWGIAALRRRRAHRGMGGALIAPAVLLVVALASAASIAPRAVSSQAPGPDEAPGVTVLTANLLRSSVEPPVLVDLVRRTGADVVALPETNAFRARQIARALSAARREPWRAETDRSTPSPAAASAAPTSLVVREALGPRRLREPPGDPRAHGQVRIALTRVGPGEAPEGAGAAEVEGPRIAAVHPLPPWPAASQADWRRDLLRLRALCRGDWVVAGDLNATIDHSPLRSVLGAGCEDAAAENGEGLKATWSGGALGIVRPAIDHVLTSGPWRATSAGVLPIEGSDHRAVWARVVRQTR